MKLETEKQVSRINTNICNLEMVLMNLEENVLVDTAGEGEGGTK